jgi:CRP-like cAMP-binding protein
MKRLRARDVLFSEGDADGKLYIVHRGEFIRQKKEGEKLRSKDVIPPHSVVGADSLLNRAPHRYTLRAMETAEVEEISQEDLSKAFETLPVWFSPFLRFMESRVRTLESNKAALDKIHAIPTFLFVVSKYAKHAKEAVFDVERLAEDIRAINGLEYDGTLDLCKGFASLGVAELIQGKRPQVHFYRKNLPQILYRTLFVRMSGRSLPRSVLSANDQTILTAFTSAAKTKGIETEKGIRIGTKDLIATYKTLFPGLKLTRRAFENLVQCGYLSTEPEFSTLSVLEEFEAFFGNREDIKDLLELNRVYPLLDKQLPKAMNQG